MLNAGYQHLRAGSARHLRPHDLPPRRTDGTWDRLMDGLRRAVRQLARGRAGGRGH